MAPCMSAASFRVLLAFLTILYPGGADGAEEVTERVQAGTVYRAHDPVRVIVNKVGPFNNPTEKYRYYSLPFCRTRGGRREEGEGEEVRENASAAADFGDGEVRGVERRASGLERSGGGQSSGGEDDGARPYRQSLGESMAGDRRETSPYVLKFDDTVERRILCTARLGPRELTAFKNAIRSSYFFEMFVEDLPMWGYIGDDEYDMDGGVSTYLFPHLHFNVGTNTGRIVSARATTDLERKVDITETNQEIEVQFTYSVEWYPDELQWKDRMSRYYYSRFLPASFEIHWLSVIISFTMVLFLTGFLTNVLTKMLKKDISRYKEIGEETVEKEESGWKAIHGDVFRFPENPSLLSASVGVGTQLICTAFALLGLLLAGLISTPNRGSILTGIVIIYCLASVIGGFTSSRLYLQMNGKMWHRCVLLTAILFPLPLLLVFVCVNSVASAHGSTSALEPCTIFAISCLYAFLSFPLTVLGGVLARNYASHEFNAPTRTADVIREIPTKVPWHRRRSFHMLIAGFVPFSAIYIELHYIFASMWGYQIYGLIGILFLSFALLVIVTSVTTVALLYFQLAREDHRWWWVAYINGGMTGIFVYLYSFYYYFQKSNMSGWFQGSFYFGYMAIVSLAFFLMLGSAGFHLSLVFVKHIYGRITLHHESDCPDSVPSTGS